MRADFPSISNREGASSSTFFHNFIPRGRRASSSGFSEKLVGSVSFEEREDSCPSGGGRLRFLIARLKRAQAANNNIKMTKVRPTARPCFAPPESPFGEVEVGDGEGADTAVLELDIVDDLLDVDVAILPVLDKINELVVFETVGLLLLGDDDRLAETDDRVLLLDKDDGLRDPGTKTLLAVKSGDCDVSVDESMLAIVRAESSDSSIAREVDLESSNVSEVNPEGTPPASDVSHQLSSHRGDLPAWYLLS